MVKVAASDPSFGFEQGHTGGSIGSGASAGAIADHEQDTSDAHHASGVSITNGAVGVMQWPMLGLSSGTPVAGPWFGGATNVQQALEYLAQAIAALSGGTPGVARHWPMLALSGGGGGAAAITSWLSVTGGGKGIVSAHGNLGSTETIDLGTGNYHWGTLNANCAFTFTGATDLRECWFTFELIEDATGGWTVTWPGSVVWLGGSLPTHTTTAGTTTIYAFFTRNGGTNWVGGQLGASVATLTVKNEGIALATAASSMDFVGPLVTATGAGADKTVTITGALDDLTDVAIASATDGDALVFTGSAWEDRPAGRHVHIVGESFVGDGAQTVFYLANEAELDSVAAYTGAGARVAITHDTTLLDKITFAAAPAAGTGFIDYVAALG